MEGKMFKKNGDFDVRTRHSLVNTLTTCTAHASFPFGLWYIIGRTRAYIYTFAFLEYYQGVLFFPGHKHIHVSKTLA